MSILFALIGTASVDITFLWPITLHIDLTKRILAYIIYYTDDLLHIESMLCMSWAII